MVPKIEFPQLPFLTREMLKFGNKVPMRLRLSCASNIAGTVTVRGITRSGVIDIATTTTADGKITAEIQGIGDFPIMLSITDEGNAFLPGQCWCSVELELNEQETITLCSGFVYVNKGPTYPAVTSQDAIPGRGFFTEVSSADPAAGVDATITVPDGELWHILSGSVVLVTDATATDRRLQLVFTYPTAVIIGTMAETAHTANTTNKYSFMKVGVILNEQEDNDRILNIAHDIYLGPASTITTDITNIQAGDNLGVLSMSVEKFFGFAEN